MILRMYVTLMPVIFAGAANMLFTKTKLYKMGSNPIDGGFICKDGKRLFGENKTWAGFFGMIFFGAFFQILWGIINNFSEHMKSMNELYYELENTLIFNLCVGALFGLAYVLFELPNSFIKRRLNIIPGKTGKGIKGKIFFVVDQIDSLIGVVGVLAFFSKMTIIKYCMYIFLGAFTHIAVNMILYALKIRKNI